MPLDLENNFATFKPDGAAPGGGAWPRIYLGIDEIPRRGGLVPDVWCAEVPYTSLAAIGLGDVSYEVSGRVELWSTHAPESGLAADVVLTNVAIVDVQPSRWGFVDAETTRRAVVYRVSIADHRRAWVAPRGGLLFDGPLNPDPLPTGQTLTANSVLMQRCADAMGVTVAIADTVDDAEAIREVDWSAEHAPTALQALLEHSGHVYAPLIGNAGVITKPGSSTGPTFPAERLISDITCSTIDRRATTAVFISAPAAMVHSFNDVGGSVPAWKYVAQDPDANDRWRPLAEIASLGTAATAWANDFKDVDAAKAVRLRQQVYRCIQLDPAKYPPGKVVLMPHHLGTDLKESEVRLYVDGLMVKVADGHFAPQQASQWLVSQHVVPTDNVIVFDQPLMKLATASATARRQHLTSAEVCVPEASLKPWFSVEAWDKDNNRRKYGVFGYIVTSSVCVAIDAATALAATIGYRPDVCVYRNPDLQLVDLNGGASTNHDLMDARATTYARNALGVSPQSPREARIKGYLPVELDGAVSGVTYVVRGCETRVSLHAWHATSGGAR